MYVCMYVCMYEKALWEIKDISEENGIIDSSSNSDRGCIDFPRIDAFSKNMDAFLSLSINK